MKRQLFVMLAIVFAVVLTSNIVIETVVSKESYLVYEEPPLIDIGFLLLAYSFSSHVFRLPFTVFFILSTCCTLEYLVLLFLVRPYTDAINEAYFGVLAAMGTVFFWKVCGGSALRAGVCVFCLSLGRCVVS